MSIYIYMYIYTLQSLGLQGGGLWGRTASRIYKGLGSRGSGVRARNFPGRSRGRVGAELRGF